ncbi:hypothetical protein [Roseiconus lacunae]|uniref:Calcium-binding protein n=1 Tax=Roseiconus lacunae TaxID=2605694 RepID=A0ABT7PS99_9BACT|nr:hypothetical protein [Roseiconus lacunae]MDM4019356.1 hypothetical protein [Roseiconus lacunae]
MFLLCFATSVGTTRAGVDYDIDDECDSETGYVQITLDDSHDLIWISRDDDDLVIRGFMFDSDDHSEIPGPYGLTDDELDDLADKDFRYKNSFDDVQRVIILCRDGNDAVLSDIDVPVEVIVFGEGGDDYIEGSMLGDNLQGGPGLDQLYGRGGKDNLHGGADGDQDWLQGDNGDDTFVQYYSYEAVPLYSFSPIMSGLSWLLRPTISRYAIRTTTTVRVDEEVLVDFDEQEDTLQEYGY